MNDYDRFSVSFYGQKTMSATIMYYLCCFRKNVTPLCPTSKEMNPSHLLSYLSSKDRNGNKSNIWSRS